MCIVNRYVTVPLTYQGCVLSVKIIFLKNEQLLSVSHKTYCDCSTIIISCEFVYNCGLNLYKQRHNISNVIHFKVNVQHLNGTRHRTVVRASLRDGPLFFWRGDENFFKTNNIFLCCCLCKQFFSGCIFLQTIFLYTCVQPVVSFGYDDDDDNNNNNDNNNNFVCYYYYYYYYYCSIYLYTVRIH